MISHDIASLASLEAWFRSFRLFQFELRFLGLVALVVPLRAALVSCLESTSYKSYKYVRFTPIRLVSLVSCASGRCALPILDCFGGKKSV